MANKAHTTSSVDPAVKALKDALLALLMSDPEVRAAVRDCIPEPLPVKLDVVPAPEPTDAERGRFIVDLIESHIPRLVRGDALRVRH